ncbi:hypothetical protein [Hymenobacter cavernae]|uniref:Uncharacterized protein n=1 Tax=Hymenobacter cavernae TaxID=2044852 RepID=A0ABQ1UUS5_9BACT|nr:hypothetical protein [Hymenobacter cavernae]GGF27345.1 hypothetical protein GCM10011383_43760 [Hymenobacter cavernae]
MLSSTRNFIVMTLLTALHTWLALAPSPRVHVPKITYTYGELIHFELRHMAPGTTGYISLEANYQDRWYEVDMDIACQTSNAVSPKVLQNGAHSYNTRLLEKTYVEAGAITVRLVVVYCADLHTCTTMYRSDPFRIKK